MKHAANLCAGADGCKVGWLVLFDDGDTITSAAFPTTADILDSRPDIQILAIDIPIGIPAAGSRACDKEARKLLKRRSSCVFPAPVRPTFASTDYASACDLHQQADGRKLSKQAHAILPKIVEVDDAVRNHPRGTVIYEVHPEVSFAAMNDMQPLKDSKHSLSGLNLRLQFVSMEFGEHAFQTVRDQHPRKTATDDDILDAFAALWTARRIQSDTAQRFPEAATFDELGVPMHINF